MQARQNNQSLQRTRSITFIGLSVALLAVSAWITIPLGPVPFTMQTFVEVFVLLALRSRESIATAVAYLFLGSLGLPLFSSMRGGIGVVAGPTGGFLIGFVIGTLAAVLFLKLLGNRCSIVVEYAAAVILLIVCYTCGWLQLSFVTGMGPAAAFVAGIAPFIIIDLVKVALAVPVARAVRKAVGHDRAVTLPSKG